MRTVAVGAIGPWGAGEPALSRWLDGGPGEEVPPPAVPGFIESAFNPLVIAVTDQCLAGHEIDGTGTAIVLTSVLGDTTTADVASRNLAHGQVCNPLLFYQSVPNAILGVVGREYGITGPVHCLSARDPFTAGLDTAELLLALGDAEAVLLLYVELATSRRAAVALRHMSGADLVGRHDMALATLLSRDDDSHSDDSGDDDSGDDDSGGGDPRRPAAVVPATARGVGVAALPFIGLCRTGNRPGATVRRSP